MVFKNPKFDLNEKPSVNGEFSENNQFHDTTLRLECSGHGGISREIARSNGGYRLVLGLGPTPSVCSNDRDLVLRLSLSNHSDSSKTDSNPLSNHRSASVEVSNGFGSHHVADESSSCASGGYMPSLLLAPRASVPLQKLKITEPGSKPGSEPRSPVHQGGGKRCVVRGWACHRCHGGKTGAHGATCKVHGGNSKRCIHDKNTFCVPGQRTCHAPVSGPGSLDNHSLSGSSSASSCSSLLGQPAKRRQMIPPQVLVPAFMKSCLETNVNGGRERGEVAAQEGRVYGGSLLSSLTGNPRDAV